MLASLPISSSSSSSSSVNQLSHPLSQATSAQQVLAQTLSQVASNANKLAQQPHISSSTNGLPPNVSQLLPRKLVYMV